MKELTPRNRDPEVPASQAPDDLLSEVLSTLGLIGAVLLLVALISLFGRL